MNPFRINNSQNKFKEVIPMANIKERAYEILRNEPETRNDDKLLGLAFAKKSPNYQLEPISFEEYCKASPEYLFNFYGVPRVETLGRYRRKFMEENRLYHPGEENTRAVTHDKQLKATPRSLFTIKNK